MECNLENGLESLINEFKKKETKYFNEKIDQIEKNTLRLFEKTFDHSLNIDQLIPLRRYLQQAIAIYEYAIKNDKFQFIAIPDLKTRLTKKLTEAIDDLKNALTIIETKLNDNLNKEQKQNNSTLEQIFVPTKKGYSICLALFEELQIIDSITGNREITDGKGYLLFGLIDAIKESRHNLLNKTYTDKKLLSIFNSHLRTNFKQLKRTSQGFKDAKKESRDYINTQLRVAPST